jgi:hypothetical protein
VFPSDNDWDVWEFGVDGVDNSFDMRPVLGELGGNAYRVWSTLDAVNYGFC